MVFAKNFFGCLFGSAANEYPERTSDIRQTSYEFKRLMRLYIRSLCDQLGIPGPDSLANTLSLLFEGAIVTAQVSSSSQAAQVAKTVAKTMIAEAMTQKTKVSDIADIAENA